MEVVDGEGYPPIASGGLRPAKAIANTDMLHLLGRGYTRPFGSGHLDSRLSPPLEVYLVILVS